MKCPHCVVEIHPGFNTEWMAKGAHVGREDGAVMQWRTEYMACPSCDQAIINLVKVRSGIEQLSLVYPKAGSRPFAPSEVPESLAEDFNEACLVVSFSPKASAALSRRCLQELLRLNGFTHNDLAKAIDSALASKTIPVGLGLNLDAIRNIGNFAAHPTKDTVSGAIVAVEPEEADWNLDVLEELFEFYYVQPAHDQAKRDALNVKLVAAGKKPMKS